MGQSVEPELNTLYKTVDLYLLRYRRSSKFFKSAREISSEEIKELTRTVVKYPSVITLTKLLTALTSSGVWVGHAVVRYLYNLIQFKNAQHDLLHQDFYQNILEHIKSDTPLTDPLIREEDIFQAIFLEREYAHFKRSNKNSIKWPYPNLTIVLVDGILNEVFSSSTFERSLKSFHTKYGLKYFIPRINGLKGTTYNANALRLQIDEYLNHNPDEKLWLIGYSKGGIDSLHYLYENSCYVEKSILGLSTIACPILGSNYFNHKLLRVVNSVHKYNENKIYNLLSKRRDFLFKEVVQYLNKENQTPWFRKNHKELPKNLFYTALAFEAKWYESHFYMILAKMIFQRKVKNDGIVESAKAQFPQYFKGINLGVIQGHHLIGIRSSYYNQEALIEAHIMYLKYKKLIS